MANSNQPRGDQTRKRRSRQWPRHRSLYSAFGFAAGLLVRYRRMVRAILIYAGSLMGFIFLYLQLDGTPLMEPMLRFNAEGSGFLASVIGISVQVSGNQLLLDTAAFHIVTECTSLAPFAIFAAAIISYPSTLPTKLLGLLLGFIALSAVNLVRITSLIYIGATFPEALDIAHLLVWQSVMVVVAVIFWVIWIRRYAHHSSP